MEEKADYSQLSDVFLKEAYANYLNSDFDISETTSGIQVDIGHDLANEVLKRAGSIENVNGWLENKDQECPMFNTKPGSLEKITSYGKQNVISTFRKGILQQAILAGNIPYKEHEKEKFINFVSTAIDVNGGEISGLLSVEAAGYDKGTSKTNRIFSFGYPIGDLDANSLERKMYVKTAEAGEELEIMRDTLEKVYFPKPKYEIEFSGADRFKIFQRE